MPSPVSRSPVSQSLVSVITAVHPPSLPYLAAAHASLVAQRMPAGWSWEWLRQEDGPTGATVGDEDPRTSAGTGRKGGPAIARNLALARARGALIRVLDADDVLTPGALARDIGALMSHPDANWATSRALDLTPDGSTKFPPAARPDGPLSDGPLRGADVVRYFQEHGYRLLVHPATLCVRRDMLVALGGWMALPGGEDTGLLLAAAAISDGYFTDEPGLLYRKHDAQATAASDWSTSLDWHARMRLTEARTIALRHIWPRR